MKPDAKIALKLDTTEFEAGVARMLAAAEKINRFYKALPRRVRLRCWFSQKRQQAIAAWRWIWRAS